MTMIAHLDALLGSAELADLFADEPAWRGMFIDYEHPHVERLWAPLPETADRPSARVMLHRIHPCEPGQALMHTHPWPSAVRILSGRYEHKTRAARHDRHSEVVSVLAAGSSYEIASPCVWHSVRPIGRPSLSIMLAGAPWDDHIAPRPPARQRELTNRERADLRAAFAEAEF